jgi:hypothetical protein
MSNAMQPKAASGGNTLRLPVWMTSRLKELAALVDRLCADLPESRLEAQRMAAEALGMTPSAEVLHALIMLADEDTAEEIRTRQGRKMVVLRLMVDLEMHAVAGQDALDLDALERATGTFPDLIHYAKGLARQFDWTLPDLGPRDQERLEKLKKSLMPALDQVQALAVLAPRVAHLARAAREGRIADVPLLEREDQELFVAALPDSPAPPPSRVCVDAAALRWAIREDLNAWDRVRPTERSDENADAPAQGDALAGLFGAEDLRLAILEHLKLDVNAYQALIVRMQHEQDAARSEGADGVVQDVSAAQRALFAAYLELTATVRNPGGTAVQEDDEATAAARSRLLREIEEVEQAGMAPSEQVKEELLLEALTTMRDRGKEQPKVKLPESKLRKKRERLRRYVLMGTTAVLAVVAVVVNVALMGDQKRAPDPIQVRATEFTSALPVNSVRAVGPMMISEVPSYVWQNLSDSERKRKAQEMGRMAEQKGFLGVLLVDDLKRELATWSERNGPRVLPTKKIPASK